MLYHPNSPYFRQFLTASSRTKKKTDMISAPQQKQTAKPNITPFND